MQLPPNEIGRDESAGYNEPQGTASAPQRPGMLMAIIVIAIVLASLGLLGSLTQGMALAFGQKMQAAQMSTTAGQMPHMEQAMREMFDETAKVGARYFWVNLVVLLAGLAISALLLFAAIRTLQWQESGRGLLRSTLMLSALFVLLRIIPTSMAQMEQLPITEAYTKAIMKPPAPAPVDADAETDDLPPAAMAAGAEFGAQVARASVIAGIVMTAIIGIVQAVFYVFGYFYLGKAKIVQLFNAESPPDVLAS